MLFDITSRVVVVSGLATWGWIRSLPNFRVTQFGRGVINAPVGVSAPKGRVIVEFTVKTDVLNTVAVKTPGSILTVPGRQPVGAKPCPEGRKPGPKPPVARGGFFLGAVGMRMLMEGKRPEGSGDNISPVGKVLIPGAVPEGDPLTGKPAEGINFEPSPGGFGCFIGAVPAGRPVFGP